MTNAKMRFTLIAPAMLLAPAVAAQTPDHSGHEQHAPAQQQPQDHAAHPAQETPADPHAGHDMSQHGERTGGHAMGSAFGDYQMTRDASGTSWVPDASSHSMLTETDGDWMLMGHVMLDGVYSWQDGPRGDEKAFIGGMLMGTAQRRFDNDSVLQFRGMLSPDPVHGQERLSAAARGGRDGRRRRTAGRPPASARSLHGAVGELFASAVRQEQRVRLCRPARRTGLRPAGLHAPSRGDGEPRGADHPPLDRIRRTSPSAC